MEDERWRMRGGSIIAGLHKANPSKGASNPYLNGIGLTVTAKH
jgi:hypothetical protein